MKNIFLLSFQPFNNDEDRFTASLNYLFDNFPDLGQQFVDILFASTGEPSPKFKRALDHPSIDATNRPDFLLECEEVNILCEHKLMSGLGDRQLERYLELANQQTKKTYLALISIEELTVSKDILNARNYLRPKQYNHFCWQDFYPIFCNSNERLAQEFADLMFHLRMNPPENFEGWEDLLSNPDTVDRFQEQWQEVREHFKKMGASCRRYGDKRPGLAINHPAPWLHLLYFYVDGFDLNSVIWLADNSPYLTAFANVNEGFLTPENRYIQGVSLEPKKARWTTTDNINPRSVALYSTALSEVLSPDTVATRKALLDFAIAVFDHARGAIEKFDRETSTLAIPTISTI